VKTDILRWLQLGLEIQATHLLVVQAGGDVFPQFVKPTQNAREAVALIDKKADHKVVRVYSIRRVDAAARIQREREHTFDFHDASDLG
jgi:NADPH-dependent ferric siderophore reductase